MALTAVTLEPVYQNAITTNAISQYSARLRKVVQADVSRALPPPDQQSVWVSDTWGGPWRYVPYLRPNFAEEGAAPTIGRAEFEFDFGRRIQESRVVWDIISAILVSGKFVMIKNHSYWGTWVVWIGIIQWEQDVAYASPGTYPQGQQRFTAYEIGHMLDRNPISTTVTDDGTFDRPVTFNTKNRRGLSVLGNRTTDFQTVVSPVSGEEFDVHEFSKDGKVWRNLDIIEHVLILHVAGFDFYIVGEPSVVNSLLLIVERHSLYGLTPWQALNKLIDRHRCLGFVIFASEDGGPLYVEIFTTLTEALYYGDYMIPGNPNVAWVDADTQTAIQPAFAYNEATNFTAIEVVGGPVRVCGTFAYADGTFEEAFTADEETVYEAGSTKGGATADDHDKARRSEKFENVYQVFRVPDNWNGTLGDGTGNWDPEAFNNALVFAPTNGLIDDSQVTGFWCMGTSFDRNIPMQEISEHTNYVKGFRAPFGVVEIDGEWQYVDKLLPPLDDAQVTMVDGDLAVHVKSRINHIIADGVFDALGGAEDTNIPTQYDYRNMAFTAMFTTDSRLRVRIELYDSPVGIDQVKPIMMPDAEAWYVVPDTIMDVVDGDLVRYGSEDFPTAADNLERWDGYRVQAMALLAAAYYCQVRATANIRILRIASAYQTGALLLGATGNWRAVQLGTCVTLRRWDFRQGATMISTGFHEIDFGALPIPRL